MQRPPDVLVSVRVHLPAEVGGERIDDEQPRAQIADDPPQLRDVRRQLDRRHLNKSGWQRAIYRGGGSIGVIAAAQIGLLVAPLPDDPEARALAVVKSHLAAKPEARSFRLEADEGRDVARVAWEGALDLDVDALLAAGERRESQADAAESFLRDALADGEWHDGAGLRPLAAAGGIRSRTTLQRAATRSKSSTSGGGSRARRTGAGQSRQP